jgi:hypothetical protein
MVCRVFKNGHLQCLWALEWNWTMNRQGAWRGLHRYGLTLLSWKDSESLEIASDLSVLSPSPAHCTGRPAGQCGVTNQHTLTLLALNWTQTTVGRQLDTWEIYLTASLHLVAKREIPVPRNQPPDLRQSVHLPSCLVCKLNVLFTGNCFGFICTKKSPKVYVDVLYNSETCTKQGNMH